jgi:hypothetical protein
VCDDLNSHTCTYWFINFFFLNDIFFYNFQIWSAYWTRDEDFVNLGDGVVIGFSLETLKFNMSCVPAVDFIVIDCTNVPGVGRNFAFEVSIGGQISNQSVQVLNYTSPVIASVQVDSWSGSSDVYVSTEGGTTANITGDYFGPVSTCNTISVLIARVNFTTEVGSTYYNYDGLESPLAKAVLLVDCAVIQDQVLATCTIPPGVGYDHRWTITVGSQNSGYLRSFKSSYLPPVISSVTTLFNSTGGSYVSDGFSTSGGDVVLIEGSNFGPTGVTNMVFASLHSETCVGCWEVDLLSTKLPFEARSKYNYIARVCEVRDSHCIIITLDACLMLFV